MHEKRQKPLRGIGNCPCCGFACQTVGNGKTPRHGHIKHGKGWLPPCEGSGLPVANYLKLVNGGIVKLSASEEAIHPVRHGSGVNTVGRL